MVTYGFYNSVDHDRTYDATQVSELFDGLIREGVYEFIGQRFAVSALSSGFQVSVGTGRAWFRHTWTKNDAELALTLPAPPTLPDRYRCDAIVLDINSDIKVRENKITYVSGEESASENPPHPSLSTGTHYQVPLAWIKRVGREENILQSNINYVVGTSVCPYVVGVLQEVDITAHVAQWQAAWEQWFQGPNGYVQTQARVFEAEIAAAETAIENATDDINEDVAEFRVWIASQKSQFDGWMDDSKDDFDTWFANLHYILDSDVAGHLQNEIEALQNRVTPIKNGGTGNSDGYIQTGFKASSDKGEFSTSEGMNANATGEAAHAEGGGGYTKTQPVEETGMYGPSGMYKVTKTFRNDIGYNNYDTVIDENTEMQEGWQYGSYTSNHLKVCYGDSVTRQAFPNRSWIPTTSDIEQNGMHSWCIGLILRDTDSDSILYHNTFSIGKDNETRDDYVGDGESTYDIDEGRYIEHDIGDSDISWKELPFERIHSRYAYVIFKNDYVALALGDLYMYNTPPQSMNGFAKFNGQYGIPSYVTDNNNVFSFIVPRILMLDMAHIDGNNPDLDLSKYEVELYFTEKGEINFLKAGESVIKINGYGSEASGDFSHAEGYQTIAVGDYAHAEGYNNSNKVDHSEWPSAYGLASHVEGNSTSAIGNASHAEGYQTKAIGDYSHTSGYYTEANGSSSNATGAFTKAVGDYSFAGGYYTKTYDGAQLAFGYNADIPGSGIGIDLTKMETSIFSVSSRPRLHYRTSDETSSITDLDEANEIVDKNRNGFTALIKCTSSKNNIFYKTLMPNDSFGTFVEFIDVLAGDPINQCLSSCCRIYKLEPNGSNVKSRMIEAVKLYDMFTGNNNSASAIVTPPTSSSINIGGTTYYYPVLTIINASDNAISDSTKDVYIKYTLMRII